MAYRHRFLWLFLYFRKNAMEFALSFGTPQKQHLHAMMNSPSNNSYIHKWTKSIIKLTELVRQYQFFWIGCWNTHNFEGSINPKQTPNLSKDLGTLHVVLHGILTQRARACILFRQQPRSQANRTLLRLGFFKFSHTANLLSCLYQGI